MSDQLPNQNDQEPLEYQEHFERFRTLATDIASIEDLQEMIQITKNNIMAVFDSIKERDPEATNYGITIITLGEYGKVISEQHYVGQQEHRLYTREIKGPIVDTYWPEDAEIDQGIVWLDQDLNEMLQKLFTEQNDSSLESFLRGGIVAITNNLPDLSYQGGDPEVQIHGYLNEQIREIQTDRHYLKNPPSYLKEKYEES